VYGVYCGQSATRKKAIKISNAIQQRLKLLMLGASTIPAVVTINRFSLQITYFIAYLY